MGGVKECEIEWFFKSENHEMDNADLLMAA